MATSDNQFIANRVRAQEQESQGNNRFDGGSWNNNGNWGKSSGKGGPPCWTEQAKFGKAQIMDCRPRRFDKRGRLIELADDKCCSILCLAINIPEAKEMVRLQKLCLLPALGGENSGITQLNFDIIAPHLNMNIKPSQAKIIADVLDFTYRSLGVPLDSVPQYTSRNYPHKHAKFQKEFAKRRVHAIHHDKDDSESSDDDLATPAQVHADNEAYLQSQTASAPNAEMMEGIRKLMENFNRSEASAPFRAAVAIPNPAERKRSRAEGEAATHAAPPEVPAPAPTGPPGDAQM